MEHQLCILEANRTKRLFFLFGFGFLIVWILFGNYDTHKSDDGIQFGKGSPWTRRRRLMEVDINDAIIQERFDPNGTYEDIECSSIHSYNSSQYCEFVSNVPSCAGDDGFIPYFDFVYCKLPVRLVPLSMIILAIWLCYLFMFLGTTAESYFCRELAYITKLLRLSQNVAGVTLLAIGNGAPDIFSAIAAFNHPDPKKSSLAFGALYGAGMFVTNIVVGMVCIFRPFQVTRRPFLRDNIFYLFAVFWIFYLLWQNEMSLWQAVGLLVYYISYVLTVVLGNLIYQNYIKWRMNKRQGNPEVVQYKKEHQVQDSMGESQSGKVVVKEPYESCRDDTSSSTSSSCDSSDEEGAHKLAHVKYGDKKNLPVVLVTKPKAEKHSDESDVSRPTTPSERSASRASQRVYGGTSDHAREPRKTPSFHPVKDPEDREETPRPRSRLEQVIDNAVYLAEDMITASNPNLAKVWQNEYNREIKRERQGSRSTTPYFSTVTTPPPPIDEETSFVRKQSSDLSSSSSDEEERKNVEFTEQTPLITNNSSDKEQIHPFKKLLYSVFPFITIDYRLSSVQSKIFQIVRYPLTFVLTLTVPVVDLNEPLNNWNKWLTIIQCIISPLFISVVADEFGLILVEGVFPVILIVLVCSIGLAVFVALTSSSDKPPIYHCVFAWIGFALSILWIYAIANEIVNVLQVFGVVVKLSDGILGITLLAWGNSIQDSVTNVTMARQGFPRMAVGACFGGPLLNILIGIGLATIIKSVSDGENVFPIYMTQVTMLAAFFLIASLASSLVFVSCLQFQMRRIYGVLLFIFYLSFIIVMILAELEVFHIRIDGVLSVLD